MKPENEVKLICKKVGSELENSLKFIEIFVINAESNRTNIYRIPTKSSLFFFCSTGHIQGHAQAWEQKKLVEAQEALVNYRHKSIKTKSYNVNAFDSESLWLREALKSSQTQRFLIPKIVTATLCSPKNAKKGPMAIFHENQATKKWVRKSKTAFTKKN